MSYIASGRMGVGKQWTKTKQKHFQCYHDFAGLLFIRLDVFVASLIFVTSLPVFSVHAAVSGNLGGRRQTLRAGERH